MTRRYTSIIAFAAAAAAALPAGCQDDTRPPYVQGQWTVEYLGSQTTVTMIGDLAENRSGDYWGYCRAYERSGQKMISVLLADQGFPSPVDEVWFTNLAWTEGSAGSVSCEGGQIEHNNHGSDDVSCSCPDGIGCCTVTVQRGEGKHTAEIFFTCDEFDTRESTGGVPNKMSILNGRMQILNCSGF